MLAVILPSRGLIHQEVLDGTDRELYGYEHKRYWSHSDRLPLCFERPVSRAFCDGAEAFWIVEEDTVPPAGCLGAMLGSDASIVACPYPLHPWGSPSWRKQLDFCWTGFGCTLIRREVLEACTRPWFAVGYQVVRHQPGSQSADHWSLEPGHDRYSGHESYFCFKSYQAGFNVEILHNYPAKHLKGEK